MPLNVTKTLNGLQLSIHKKLDFVNCFYAFMQLFAIAIGGGVFYSSKDAPGHRAPHGGNLWILFVVCTLFAWILFWFKRDVVTVNKQTFRRDLSLLGINFLSNTYVNSDVENLRCEQWHAGRAGLQSAIKFEYHGVDVAFAEQAMSPASLELVDDMRKIYPFPAPQS